ncbi:MEDS domain-containing protein, partial [Actinoplanes couchii]
MATATSSSHACWSYDDPGALEAYAKEFLRAGLAAGERVWYVPGPRSTTVTDWLRSAGPTVS